jgi:hypothetical protein
VVELRGKVVGLVGEVVLKGRVLVRTGRVLPPVALRKAMCLVWGWVNMVRRVMVECIWEEDVMRGDRVPI